MPTIAAIAKPIFALSDNFTTWMVSGDKSYRRERHGPASPSRPGGRSTSGAAPRSAEVNGSTLSFQTAAFEGQEHIVRRSLHDPSAFMPSIPTGAKATVKQIHPARKITGMPRRKRSRVPLLRHNGGHVNKSDEADASVGKKAMVAKSLIPFISSEAGVAEVIDRQRQAKNPEELLRVTIEFTRGLNLLLRFLKSKLEFAGP